MPGEVLVRFDNADAGAIDRVLRAHGARTARRLPVPGLRLVRLPPGLEVRAAAAALARVGSVRYAEPNFYRKRLALTPNDPRFGSLWGLHNTGQTVPSAIGPLAGTADADIDAPEAWDTTTGSGAITVAVLDDGVEMNHPDLAPNIWTNPGESGGGKESNGLDDDSNGYVDDWSGWDVAAGDNDPSPTGLEDGHGTHVAGTIGARGNNGLGITGVNWQVGIMPLRAFEEGGMTSADMVEGFAYASQNGARVLNGSFGAPEFSSAENDAIGTASNVLFVFAAGNDGANADAGAHYPCAYPRPNVICVGATDQLDQLAPFSTYGSSSVDLAAPGTAVHSTVPVGTEHLVLEDDFETAIAGRWTTGGVNNSWARTTARWTSPVHSLTDSPVQRYANDTDSYARSPSMDLSEMDSCLLIYDMRLDVEPDYDGLVIEASADGVSWSEADAWTGFSDWDEFITEIPSLDGAPAARVGFRLITDPSVMHDGAHIDNPGVACIASQHTYVSLDGTSMAAPQVAGAAALVWSAFPDASVADVRTAILQSVDQKASLAGKVATGGRLNLNRAVLGESNGGSIEGVDLTPPGTRLGKSTIQPSRRRATFRFGSTEFGSAFQCKLDSRAYVNCSSGKTYSRLARGWHKVRIRARDAAGNRDATPATRRFRI